MRIPQLAFKIAAQLIEESLMPQGTEPADVPTAAPRGRSVLSLLGKDDRVTAKEPAPKVVTDSGKQVGQ